MWHTIVHTQLSTPLPSPPKVKATVWPLRYMLGAQVEIAAFFFVMGLQGRVMFADGEHMVDGSWCGAAVYTKLVVTGSGPFHIDLFTAHPCAHNRLCQSRVQLCKKQLSRGLEHTGKADYGNMGAQEWWGLAHVCADRTFLTSDPKLV